MRVCGREGGRGRERKRRHTVVVVSCPPGLTPLAKSPSKRMGFSSAREVYMAAVCAAGPLPMMHTFVSISSFEEDAEKAAGV